MQELVRMENNVRTLAETHTQQMLREERDTGTITSARLYLMSHRQTQNRYVIKCVKSCEEPNRTTDKSPVLLTPPPPKKSVGSVTVKCKMNEQGL